ncbi:MAG: thioredoxin domain-containing protein [Cyclobacteriaceae bacterium]|nr:thioredoxin domain-containing protein [Cyclobacteriaceae bacterium]
MTLNLRSTYSLAFIVLLFAQCEPKKNTEQSFNRLAQASSPYLKEHADNPVDWYEWGPEALEKAKNERKPLIVSVGYASCHWCHVMEEESFMDTTVARIMNENFISIKVDREERPDIDQIYIHAAQLISGNAGWPLNAFAMPDGKPFYVATYFPKEQWINLLRQILDTYKNDYNKVVIQADAITRNIQTTDLITVPESNQINFGKKNYQDMFSSWQPEIDFINGGLSGTQKFPMPAIWESLLQHYYLTGEKKSLEAATITLGKMASGGIYDHLAGGFARYTTDTEWKTPHFEKMLYDNAQLISLYAHAYQVTSNPRYSKVIQETLEFIQQELTSPEGGFYSSINADSEGEEGKFYVWTKSEIEKHLDVEEATIFIDYYSITKSGNWEDGKNIIYRTSPDEEFSHKHSLPSTELNQVISHSKKILLDVRNRRIHPTRDDKILTSWNALMLTGYLDAYQALNKNEYLEISLRSAKFIETHGIHKDGSTSRTLQGPSKINGFLDDYALLAKAYINLYQATFDIHWLELSRNLVDYTINYFYDEKTGMFFYTSAQSNQLVVRTMELSDNVIPSSNSVMAEVLFQLGEYYDYEKYKSMSNSMLAQITQNPSTLDLFHANWARITGIVTHRPFEVAVMGEDALKKSHELQQHYLPTSLFMGGSQENLPLLENKLVAGKTIIYVCKDKVCKLPVQEVQKALTQLKSQ